MSMVLICQCCKWYIYHKCRVEPGKNSSNSMIWRAFGNETEWEIPNTIWFGWVTVTILNQKQLGSFYDWTHLDCAVNKLSFTFIVEVFKWIQVWNRICFKPIILLVNPWICIIMKLQDSRNSNLSLQIRTNSKLYHEWYYKDINNWKHK